MKKHENIENDIVCSPSHYTQDSIETIDKMQVIFGVDELIIMCKGNCFKYLDRYMYKNNPLQDLAKAYWYATKIMQLITFKDDLNFNVIEDSAKACQNYYDKNPIDSSLYAYKAKIQLHQLNTNDSIIESIRYNIAVAYFTYKDSNNLD